MNEECKHEVDIALLQKTLPNIETKIDNLTESILGNGKVGIKTQLELHNQSINRLWKTIAGSWLGLMILLVVKTVLACF